MNNLLNKSSYYYDLPDELIAQTPIMPRDHSRLLVYNRDNNEIRHNHFYDIVDYLREGDVLVVNKSKVLPARLFGKKAVTNASIEVLLQKRIGLNTWEVIAKPFKRLQPSTEIIFSNKLKCSVIEKKEYGECIVKFDYTGSFESILDEIGNMPLPPYIKEKLEDKNRYQTVYAKVDGSSAAPTAGLHFTDELLDKIKNKGVKIVEVVLHVGLGTFRPVKEENILEHKMHTEHYILSKENADIINNCKASGGRVIAVGTTSVRVLESCATEDGNLKQSECDTSIFIYPSYKFKVVDGLITNFHLPESTLIMLVSAFAGYENTMKLYKTAVNEKYRFFSFGDANLIL